MAAECQADATLNADVQQNLERLRHPTKRSIRVALKVRKQGIYISDHAVIQNEA